MDEKENSRRKKLVRFDEVGFGLVQRRKDIFDLDG